MNILDIAIAKKLAGGGGGSGTDNYNDLSNLPKINDTTLSGNKSSSALGLQSEINSESKLASDLVDDTNQDNKFVTSTEKNTWNGKQNAIDADHKINADYVDDSTSTNKFVTASDKETWNAKQNAIDADHKINADYVDDSTSTNKFVTASDKETWNAKQNAIDNSHKLSSDLVDDTNHTNKFVTSTEKQTWNAKQNAIDADHKLSSSLVSFSTAEAAAIASGIDSSKVGQISTNQTNILYAIGKTGKNLFELDIDEVKSRNTDGTWSGNNYTVKGVTFTFNTDGTISTTGTATSRLNIVLTTYIPSDNRFQALNSMILSGCPTGGAWNKYSLKLEMPTSPYSSAGQDVGTGTVINTSAIPNTASLVGFYLDVYANYPTSATTFKPMICTADDWAVGHDFAPYALPNYDLTRLEAEDRASLAEVVDSGAKQLIPYNSSVLKANNTLGTWNNNVYTYNSVTFTVNSDDSISVNRSAIGTSGVSFRLATNAAFSPGTYVLSAGSGTLPQDWTLSIDWSDNTHTYVTNSTNPTTFTLTAAKTGNIYIWVSTPSGSFTYKPMLCTKAAFGVSNKFVPYRPPYDTIIDAVNHYKSDTTTTIGTDWTLTSIVLNAPADAIVSLTACATWGAKAPRGIRVTRSNISATDNVIINTETDTDQAVITASGIVKKLNGNNTYYVWAKAKETATLLPVHLQYSYLMKS